MRVFCSILISLLLTTSTMANGWVFETEAQTLGWVLPKEELRSGPASGDWFVPVSNRQVLFFTADWCAQCLVIKNIELPALVEAGWRVGEKETDAVRVVDIDSHPGLWEKYGSEDDGLPQFVCLYEGEVIRSLRGGCSTPMDAYGISWAFKGIDERPEPKHEPVTVKNNGMYPVRGNWWSVEGNWNASRRYVINHLLTSPNHRELRPYSDMIKKLSRAEAHSLHSDHHEGRVENVLRSMKKVSLLRTRRPNKSRQYAVACPT